MQVEKVENVEFTSRILSLLRHTKYVYIYLHTHTYTHAIKVNKPFAFLSLYLTNSPVKWEGSVFPCHLGEELEVALNTRWLAKSRIASVAELGFCTLLVPKYCLCYIWRKVI